MQPEKVQAKNNALSGQLGEMGKIGVRDGELSIQSARSEKEGGLKDDAETLSQKLDEARPSVHRRHFSLDFL